MVKEHCHSWETLAAVDELAADDPRRSHLARCPRCRARLSAYRAFMAGDWPADLGRPTVELAAARAQLDATLARQIYAADDRPAGRSDRPRNVGRFAVRAWRPALALAAVLVLVFGLQANDSALELAPADPGTEPLLRSSSARSPSDQAPQIVPAPEADTWLVTWQTPPEASGGTVVLYDAELTEVARFAVGDAETFRLRKTAVTAPERVAFLRIVFDASGDEIGGGQPCSFSF